jgi:DsbC/DsbD-like thiol-disulfide interchange protein
VAADAVSPWRATYNSKARVVAGLAGGPSGSLHLYAGIEIALEPGWKTYWRMPGDAGGIAPTFAFEGSKNLMSATVLYPAPARLSDAAGDSVGYKSRVVFPVRLVAQNPAEPIELAVQFEYGICREICVPAEVALALTIAGGLSSPAPDQLAKALAAVPSKASALKPRDPVLVAARVDLATSKVLVDVRYASPTTDADLFVESPDGIYLPLPRKVAVGAGTVTFEIEMADGISPAELSEKTLVFTMVGGGGQSEATWTAPAIRAP